MTTDFNSVLFKALNRAKDRNLSILDTIGLISDYMDIAEIPIPGVLPPPLYIVPPPNSNEPIVEISRLGPMRYDESAYKNARPSYLSIESPIDIQIKTLDETYAEVKAKVPDTISIIIPGFEDSPPRKYAIEVSKVNNDPHMPGTVRIRFVSSRDRSECESQVVYYATDTIDVQKDLHEFEQLVKNKYRNREGKINSTFTPITALPSILDDKNAVHLGNM